MYYLRKRQTESPGNKHTKVYVADVSRDVHSPSLFFGSYLRLCVSVEACVVLEVSERCVQSFSILEKVAEQSAVDLLCSSKGLKSDKDIKRLVRPVPSVCNGKSAAHEYFYKNKGIARV